MAWFIPSWRGKLKNSKERLDKYLLGEASSLAEDLVGDYFNLADKDWRKLQYEVLLNSNYFLCLPPKALAGLFLLETSDFLPRRRRNFYKLVLAEDQILSLGLGASSLRALLLYIFTHELIHMIRFTKFAASFWMPEKERLEEEKKVHLLSKEVLSLIKNEEIEKILKHFDKTYLKEV
ncbi:hypothetical protein Thein_0930 [Thermodesulfatator indicus DSM 15286]|uniref:Uncharacterized protein n=1 Tax=Thermodesulfatator indicus (strain DSM 15286 / JCM 11887 / CIR29812) TaxID=667014 RepID=F8AD72_THEID|nr:hypothetical protein [Thermodesulfatator indicus]AEH44804.1 hypothetical protein Thein_0930 [Thermodesulfatator indicus DSM 15286]